MKNMKLKNQLIILIIILWMIIPVFSLGYLVTQPDAGADQIVPAQTIYDSNKVWTKDNYIIEGNITIAKNANLTIQKGSNLKFKGNYTIYVNGGLYITGTSAEHVQLVPNVAEPEPGFWGGIKINDTGSGSINYADILYANHGVYLDQVQNYSIKSTTIHYSSISGLVCDSTNETYLSNNSFSFNNYIGLRLISAENTTIKYNTINANEIGINLSGSINNYIGNNSISNQITNAIDNDTTYKNDWVSNYYSDSPGVDDTGDFIAKSTFYGLSPGYNGDSFPRTKIYNNINTKTYPNLASAIQASAPNMIIIVEAHTPGAGSQTLPQQGYFYENLKIHNGLGHDIILSGQGADKVILDGNNDICINKTGDHKLIINGFAIANSKIGVYLHTGANNCTFSNLTVRNNDVGMLLENSRDVTVYRCNFDYNTGQGGLLIEHSKRINVLEGYFNNSDYGILLTNSNYNLIINSSCNSNTYAGLMLDRSSYNIINTSEFASNLDYAVILDNLSDFNYFTKNEFKNNPNGILLNHSSDNNFRQSRIIANSLWGIYFNQQANNNVFLGIGVNDFQGSDTAIVVENNSVNTTFINSSVGSNNLIPLWINDNSSITFLNSVLNENIVAILDDNSTMTMKYFLTVQTVNKTNVPIPNASVEVYDNKSILIAAGDTNVNGELIMIPCIHYIRNQTWRDYSSNNHIIIANDNISTQIAYIYMSSTKIKIFKFNYIPLITTEDNLTAIEKVYYSVKYEALSLEPNKNITWSLETNTSSWLQLDSANGTIFGTPHNRDVGQPWVRVIASDSDGDSAESLFTLTIQNTLPQILTTDQLTVFEDNYYYVDYNSTDDDGYFNDTGVLIFPEDNLTTWKQKINADWLKFDNESGILNGTPHNNHVGNYEVQIFVNDGHGGETSSSFTLTVRNTPPKIISPDQTVAYKNVKYYIDYNSSDDGQGVMTWSLQTNANSAAKWLYFDETNGILNGTPGQENVGSWWMNITVEDDHGGVTSHNFTLRVIDLNLPPIILTTNVETAYANKLYSIQYTADDPDTPLQNLSWAYNTNATWLNIDPETGLLSGTPKLWHAGNWYWVNITLADNEGGFDYTEFIINVNLLPNTPPSLVESSLIVDNEITVEAFHTWKHQFKAEDDYTPADRLNWSVATNALWLSIDNSTGEISGRPEPQDSGRYWVNVTVTDEEGLFNFTNFTVIVKHTNQAPRLSDSGMTPLNGTEEDWFTFYVIYKDADNDTGKVWIWIDNRSYVMNPEPNSNLRFHEGVNYTYRTKLKPGVHTYYFEARDAWDLAAKLDDDVPSKDNPATTNEIKKVVHVPYYLQPMCWVTGVIIIIILLCILQFVLKPMSKRYPKLAFVNRVTLPERINPVVQYNLRREREASGELGYLCPSCKSVISEDAKECEVCGENFTVMEYLCPNCSAEVDGTDLFCAKCGAKFEEEEIEEEEEEPVDDEEPVTDEEPEDDEPNGDEHDEEKQKLAPKVKQISKSTTKALPAAKTVTDDKKEIKKAKRVDTDEESKEDSTKKVEK